MSSTAVLDITDALLRIAGTSASPDVEVVDTYTLHPGKALQLVIAASNPLDITATPGWSSRLERLAGYAADSREITTVLGRVIVPASDNPRDARVAAIDVYTSFKAAIRVDATLGGVVIEAGVSDFSGRMADGPSGEELHCDFLVVCSTFISET